jgi:hypothetical protein
MRDGRRRGEHGRSGLECSNLTAGSAGHQPAREFAGKGANSGGDLRRRASSSSPPMFERSGTGTMIEDEGQAGVPIRA